ncbi:MAG TPA: HAMP domain-containing sensor histidine kinase [Pseudobdellovibrionaceae bacterium]|nr:HAMP domain-containing sensor histidine kinase [Pseudobdellovibrionaceae bacterium]
MKNNILLKRLILRTSTVFFLLLFILSVSIFMFQQAVIKNEALENLKNERRVIFSIINQHYLSGDLLSLRNFLTTWANLNHISGELQDLEGNILWSHNESPYEFVTINERVLSDINSNLGIFITQKNISPLINQKRNQFIQLLLFLIIVSLMLFIVLYLVALQSLKPLSQILNILKNESSQIGFTLSQVNGDELNNIQSWFKEISTAWRNEAAKSAENAKLKAFSQIAKQVAHDIRSPLSALNMVVPSLDQIPENKRVLIRNAIGRINDIANSLLEKGKQSLENPIQNLDPLEASQSIESILVSSLIDSLVSEKRIQYRENSKLNIEANLQESYGLFIQANPADLKRVISNLINNSVEAFDNNSGNVEVIVNANENNVVISIVDNGKGIPKSILERLGEKGITYGKTTPNSGSGLGIYHAKKTVESFNGKFQVESTEGNGTTIQLIIPKTKCPDWFVPELNLEPNQKIIICDDDSSIHGLWSGRFASKSKDLHEIHFSSAADIISWVQKEKVQDLCLFLMDYELLNSPKTGLDLIEELGIAAKSILVTSRFEESWIQNRCKKLGVRLIPKGLASLVPIKIQNIKIKYDAVLIDDDLLIHMTWNLMAKEKNKKIICFTDENLFLNACDEIHFESSLYIDMNLKDGKSGIQVAENLYKKGFKNISLATGYDMNSIEKPPYIKSILGKDFPF